MKVSYQSLNQMLLIQWFYKRYNFLKSCTGERDHNNYGITHTIKHVFVNEEEKSFIKML